MILQSRKDDEMKMKLATSLLGVALFLPTLALQVPPSFAQAAVDLGRHIGHRHGARLDAGVTGADGEENQERAREIEPHAY